MATSEPVWGIPDYQQGNFYAALSTAPTSWAMGAVNIDQLRLAGGDGEGEVICVLDTGIDTDHPEFAGRIVDAKSFVPGESAEDRNGHGSHCASTAAGHSPTVGVANRAKILVGKVLSNSGSGNSSWIQDGFRWGMAAGATQFTISIGGPGFLQGMESLFAEAEARGLVVNVAAGNERQQGGRVSFRSSGLVNAACDRVWRIAGFSNPGVTPEMIDLASPGVEIVGAWPGGGYNSISGTSMATPLTAGVTTAFNSARRKLGLPPFKTSDFRKAFSQRLIDKGATGRDRDFGFGVLDCHFLRSLLIPDPPEVR